MSRFMSMGELRLGLRLIAKHPIISAPLILANRISRFYIWTDRLHGPRNRVIHSSISRRLHR